MPCDKQSEPTFLFEGPVKTTIDMLYDKGLFDNYDNAEEEVIKDCPLIERRRPDLDPNK